MKQTGTQKAPAQPPAVPDEPKKSIAWITSGSAVLVALITFVAAPLIHHALNQRQPASSSQLTPQAAPPPEPTPQHISSPQVAFSDWKDTKTSHDKSNNTYGDGNFKLSVSPAGTSVYVENCMKQEQSHNEKCSVMEGPYQSGPVKFKVVDVRDWHLVSGGSVTFQACAYASNDSKSRIGCSDVYLVPHLRSTRKGNG